MVFSPRGAFAWQQTAGIHCCRLEIKGDHLALPIIIIMMSPEVVHKLAHRYLWRSYLAKSLHRLLNMSEQLTLITASLSVYTVIARFSCSLVQNSDSDGSKLFLIRSDVL